MKKKNYTPTVMGDIKQYPVLVNLTSMLNDCEQKIAKYCTSLVNEMFLANSYLNSMEKEWRIFFTQLLRKEFLERIDTCKSFTDTSLPDSELREKIRTHMRNYVVAYHREQIKRVEKSMGYEKHIQKLRDSIDTDKLYVHAGFPSKWKILRVEKHTLMTKVWCECVEADICWELGTVCDFKPESLSRA